MALLYVCGFQVLSAVALSQSLLQSFAQTTRRALLGRMSNWLFFYQTSFIAITLHGLNDFLDPVQPRQG